MDHVHHQYGSTHFGEVMTDASESPREARIPKNYFLTAKTITNIGTWNAQTASQPGEIEQIIKERENCNLDILGISEMRWKKQGKKIIDGTTIIFSGNEEHHINGVGILMSKKASNALVSWKAINERLITARFISRHAKITVIMAYAPTEKSSEEDKDTFYEQLHDIINEIPCYDIKLMIGDFNAQIDNNRAGFETTIGPFGSGLKTTDNGERLITFCSVDYICISKRWNSSLQDVRVRRGADVGSDHYLVCAKIKIKLKKQKVIKKEKPIDLNKFKNPKIANKFKLELKNRFDILSEPDNIEGTEEIFTKTVMECADKIIGKKRGTKREQWISEKTWELIDKRKELKKIRDSANDIQAKETSKLEYQSIDKLVKKKCNHDKNAWLEEKIKEADNAAKKNDTKTLYRIIKDITGTQSNSSVPIQDKNGKILGTEEEQNERWVEHFKDVLNQTDPPSTFDFSNIVFRPLLKVIFGKITKKEVRKAIKALKNNKAAGIDRTCAELLKYGGKAVVN